MAQGFLFDGPADAGSLLVLAHGAGQPMDSDFMDRVASGVAAAGPGPAIRVCRFEFPYMASRRAGGKRRPPDRERVLLDAWRATLEATARLGWGAARTAIGGKSMGGRMASLIADEAGVAGLVCLGYPFHPPGRPERLRTAHLAGLRTPALICQGERDPFGGRDEVYRLSPRITLHWAADGDHDLKPRKASGRTHEDNLHAAIAAVAAFVRAGTG